MQVGTFMFQQGSLRLFSVRGVPIRAHWTLLLIVPYLAFVLSLQFRSVAELAGVEGARLVLPPLIWGVILALALFASITLHELAHTFAAVRFGGRVRSITLMLVGGVTQLARAPRRPAHEAIMAAVGPATSLVLGALLYLVYASADGWPADVRMALFYLAATNLTLGVFNLIPAFPMDGGRLLRAALAAWTGRERATHIAARVGKVCAVVLGLLGLVSASFLLMLIAVFVYTGAQGELLHERVRTALEGLRIVDLLPPPGRPPPVIGPDVRVAEVLPRMRDLDRLELVVVDPLGAPLTVLQAGDLAAISPDEHGSLSVGELASRLPVRHVLVPEDASANDAIECAAEAGAPYVIVTGPRAAPPDNLIGLVAAEDIARTVTLQTLGRRPRPPVESAR
jgi:Zn-dependent protease/CBS domain-containing protein